jgi:hypothetical protein
MLRFAEYFPKFKILHTLSAKLSWKPFHRALIVIEDSLKRDFYMHMAEAEGWSPRTLREWLDTFV